jgi:hypothetical protein
MANVVSGGSGGTSTGTTSSAPASTAKSPGSSPIIDNGPFDPRITTIPFTQKTNSFSGGGALTRGFIIQQNPIGGSRYRCNFLYNPSIVSLTHGIDPNVVTNPAAINPNDKTAGQVMMPLNQTLSFNLLFDRSYELWDSSKLYGDALTWVPVYGVAYDIISLYKITGIATALSDITQIGTSTSDFLKGKFTTHPAGPMLWVPVYIVIGSTLSYYGVIQELDIQFTHFTQGMIPMRCQVGVTVTLLPTPAGTKYQTIIGPTVANWGDPLSASQALGNSGKAGR